MVNKIITNSKSTNNFLKKHIFDYLFNNLKIMPKLEEKVAIFKWYYSLNTPT